MQGLNIINDDIVLKDNDFEMLDNDLLVAVERLATTNKGEYFLDLNMGLQYADLTAKQFNLATIKNTISECVMQDIRITEVYDITAVANGRELQVKFKYTADGETWDFDKVFD